VLETLLALHLLGLAMGLSVPLANIILGSIAANASPDERAAYAKFPPRMARVGDIGLVLLWTTGPAMLFKKYGGFAGQPWTFHVKLTAVVVLTLGVGMIHANMRKAFQEKDPAALARIQNIGKVTMLSALVALVFAVITFK
jgi:hypothetical protein